MRLLILAALLLGFVAYGLSIYFYILAQRNLGAAKTSAYYAIAPFLGVAFSFLIFREMPEITFFIALAIMLIGTYFSVTDTITLQHIHKHIHAHTHEHEHDGVAHTHEHMHNHSHIHSDSSGENHEHIHGNVSGHEHRHTTS